MRLHLWHRLFLAFALLSGAALFGFAAWQQHGFRRGFIDYLDQIALQRLAAAAARLSAAYVEHGGWDFLRDDPRRLPEYIEGRSDRDGEPGEPPPPDRRPDDRGPPQGPRAFCGRPPPGPGGP